MQTFQIGSLGQRLLPEQQYLPKIWPQTGFCILFSNFFTKYFEMMSMIYTLFPVDSIVASLDGIGVLSDRTWLLAMVHVLELFSFSYAQ